MMFLLLPCQLQAPAPTSMKASLHSGNRKLQLKKKQEWNLNKQMIRNCQSSLRLDRRKSTLSLIVEKHVDLFSIRGEYHNNSHDITLVVIRLSTRTWRMCRSSLPSPLGRHMMIPEISVSYLFEIILSKSRGTLYEYWPLIRLKFPYLKCHGTFKDYRPFIFLKFFYLKVTLDSRNIGLLTVWNFLT